MKKRVLSEVEEQPSEIIPIDAQKAESESNDEPTPLHQRLEGAAELLLSQLAKPMQELVLDFAKVVHKVPLWQFFLGTLMSQYQSGQLSAPYFDPAWRDTSEQPDYSKECPICNKNFSPTRYGQLFCSNECGEVNRRLTYTGR